MRSLTQTYGLTELLHAPDRGNYYADAWFWCRLHRRAELGSWTMLNCIRIGPLMREEEAASVGQALVGA